MSALESVALAVAELVPAPACDRCGAILREGNGGQLCDPCADTVASCAPYLSVAVTPAPEDVNLLELVAGIILVHDALHPGESLYLREALAVYGVDVDHIKVWQICGKLKRRHGLILKGEPREPGYVVTAWEYLSRHRLRDSIGGTTPDYSALRRLSS